MALTGVPPTLPGAQAQCTASSFKQYGRQCTGIDPCTECKYWPIYPCYRSDNPMVHCIAEYDNDFVSSGRDDPDNQSSGKYMFDASEREGQDTRFIRFSPSVDGTIPGGHRSPNNLVYWQVACWGMAAPCSPECETSFSTCVASQDTNSASKQVAAFKTCIDEVIFSGLTGCKSICSPTLKMMKLSETPTSILNGENFGSSQGTGLRPATSLCLGDDYLTTGNSNLEVNFMKYL